MYLVYLALAWLAGIWLAHLLHVWGITGCATPGWLYPTVAVAMAALGMVLRRQRVWALVAVLVCVASLGAWRYAGNPLEPCLPTDHIALCHAGLPQGLAATVEGRISEYPDVRATRSYYRVSVNSLQTKAATSAVRGDVLVQAPRYPVYGYGDYVRVTGRLADPEDLAGFDYRTYLARQGLYSVMRNTKIELMSASQERTPQAWLFGLRARAAAVLNRLLPEPSAALACGILLGIDRGLPADLDEAFKASSTAHIIVISGSNIALLSGLLMAICARVLGRRWAVVPVTLVIGLYVFLVGGDAPALRAGIMGALCAIGLALGRQPAAAGMLAGAALLMTLVNPLALWDVSFQLSALATLGLALFAAPLQARVSAWLGRLTGRWPGAQALLAETVAVTLAAQITTTPLLTHYFGRLSPVSLLANLLVTPAQPAVILSALAALGGGLLYEPLGRAIAAVAWLFLTYTITMARLAAALPLASLPVGQLGRAAVLLWYVALGGVLVARRLGWRPNLHAVLVPALALIAGAVACWSVLLVWQARPDGRLHLFYLPVGKGEAVLVVAPDGSRLLVWDGQGNPATLGNTVSATPASRSRTMDAVIAPSGPVGPPGMRQLDPAVLVPGATLQIGEVQVQRMPGTAGWLLELRYRDFHTLLPARLTTEQQLGLAAAVAGLSSSAFKLPEAGRALPPPAYLAAIVPQVVIWPADADYPTDVTDSLARFPAAHIPAGALAELITDGRQMWVQAWWAGSPH